MKDHGFATMRRSVRKSSSMTLNEALCERQPVLFFLYIYIYIYILYDHLHCALKLNHLLVPLL
jgi:hypothetical protein